MNSCRVKFEEQEKQVQANIAATAVLGKEKTERMAAYAKELRRKHPQMSPARLQRKVCEYFKVKLT